MQVTGTTASSTAATASQTATASANAAPTVDYNAFLRLLIAQILNQDPTKPMDSTQYMAQLASFSSVEQAVQTNAKLDALMTNSMLSQADAVIGRTLTSADGAVSGRVASVTLTKSGVMATLDGGAQILVTDGVKVR
jgi:flagellar basal-body rod modification protein FlgD